MPIIDYFNYRLTENQKIDIMNMYDNIQTYDYYDLFDTDMSFNTMYTIRDRKKYSLLKPKHINYIKSTVISSDKTKIYKMYIFQNNNRYTDYLILNSLIGTYFQTIFKEYLTHNNITEFTVPEIYRYGLINLESNNEIICFSEMKYYESTGMDELHTELDKQQTPKQKLEKIYDYLDNFKSIVLVIQNIESQLQIYHNDMVYDKSLTQIQDKLTTIKTNIDCIDNFDDPNSQTSFLDGIIDNSWSNTHTYVIHNLFRSNNKYILIDFEDSSYINDPSQRKRINDVFSAV